MLRDFAKHTASIAIAAILAGRSFGQSGAGTPGGEGGAAIPPEAQDDAGSSAKFLNVTLLAVGERPPMLFKDTATGPILLEPAKEDFPPPMLFLKSKQSRHGFETMQLSLNNPMPRIKLKAGQDLVLFENKENALAENDGEAAKSKYLQINLPDENTDITVILARDPKSKSWRTTPGVLKLKSDVVSFPPGSMRMINLSQHPVSGRLAGGKVFVLNGAGNGRIWVEKVNIPNNVLTYQFGTTIKGENIVLADSAISFYKDARMNMVFYDGDSKDTQGRLRYCQFVEPAPEPPKSAPAAKTGATGQASAAEAPLQP